MCRLADMFRKCEKESESQMLPYFFCCLVVEPLLYTFISNH